MSRVDFVELLDGSRVSLWSLGDRAPSLVRRSPEHIELCLAIAADSGLDDDSRRLYANQLVVHSTALFQLSVARFLIERGELVARRIQTKLAIPDTIASRFPVPLTGGPVQRYLPNHFLMWLIIKILAHWLYRGVRRPQWKSSELIRAYVETTVDAGLTTEPSPVVFTYPFKTNFWRQLAYWRKAWRAGHRVHRMGLPYRGGDPFQLIWPFRRNDLAAVHLEARAHARHAQELHNWGFRTVFSDSESETGGWVLNQALDNLGVRTVNASHGVGVYGPFLYFSECHFYNEPQWAYYRPYSQLGTSKFKEPRAPRRASVEAVAGQGGDPSTPTLVMLRGNWTNVGKRFEARVEQEIVEALQQVHQRQGLPLVIRFHPNTSRRERQRVCRASGASDYQDSPTIATSFPLFFNTLSTVYYSFAQDSPVVFVRHPWQDPCIIFGSKILSVEVTQLNAAIAALCDRRVRAWLVQEQRVLEQRVLEERLEAGGPRSEGRTASPSTWERLQQFRASLASSN